MNEESIALVKNIYDYLLPYFFSDKFNVACDETFEKSGLPLFLFFSISAQIIVIGTGQEENIFLREDADNWPIGY